MNKAEIDQIKMRKAFTVVYDIMKAWDVEYPFAVIWQTFDEDGNEDYTVMRPSDTWDINHGDKEEHMADIVHDHVGQAG